MLGLKDTNQDVNHVKIAAVIRYKTHYIVQRFEPFILSFALGHSVNLRCVLGLPTLLSIGRLLICFLGNFLVRNSIENFPVL